MIKQNLFCLGHSPLCKTAVSKVDGGNTENIKKPLHEKYIRRFNTAFYICTVIICEPYRLVSMTQLLSSISNLKQCYPESRNQYVCEAVKYNNFKNNDKLLFLTNNIPTSKFYLADCLIYGDGDRVCHKKRNVYLHAKLIDTGTIARPNEDNILSQDELLCEETENKKIYCNVNRYSPTVGSSKNKENIILKRGSYIATLKFKCEIDWCGYVGAILPTRRGMADRERYEPPGGSVYRCYYAKKQQICKKLYGPQRQVYNERAWLST